MKFLLAATLASAVSLLGSVVNAAGPYFPTSGCSSGYGYSNPSYGYGYGATYGYSATPACGGYQSYQSYPQYSSSWNSRPYASQSLSYDPVHGDYHVNSGYSMRPYNQGYSTYGAGNGYGYRPNYGW